jgi:methylmalonyl-CoA mutase N-terminal domain/subunit
MEEGAEAIFAEVDAMGDGSMLEGVLGGIERGWFQKEIAESAFREQRRFEAGELVRVGVNRFVEDGEAPIDTLVIGEETERAQVERVQTMRAARDPEAAEWALAALIEAAGGDGELIEPLVACARARCTEGEIVRALVGVFGDYRETPRI